VRAKKSAVVKIALNAIVFVGIWWEFCLYLYPGVKPNDSKKSAKEACQSFSFVLTLEKMAPNFESINLEMPRPTN
jgi:hypothetical protein